MFENVLCSNTENEKVQRLMFSLLESSVDCWKQFIRNWGEIILLKHSTMEESFSLILQGKVFCIRVEGRHLLFYRHDDGDPLNVGAQLL